MCWLGVPEELLPKAKNENGSMPRQAECKENQLSSLSFGKAITMMTSPKSCSLAPKKRLSKRTPAITIS